MASDDDRAGAYDPNLTAKLLAEAAWLVQAFGFAGGHVTIVGGLVPGLLVPVLEPGIEHHVGTRDLDLCLSVNLVNGDVGSYERLEKCLKDADFQMARDKDTNQPISWRWVGGADVSLTVEFFCPAGPERPPGKLHRPGGSVGGKLSALALAAGELIDLDGVERILDVVLPAGGGNARVPIRVAGLAGYVAAKVDALMRRSKNKDAYDLVWLLEAWTGGPSRAAQAARGSPVFSRPGFRTSLSELGRLFADIDAVGPRRYAAFMDEDGVDPDRLARKAVGAIATFLRGCSSANRSGDGT